MSPVRTRYPAPSEVPGSSSVSEGAVGGGAGSSRGLSSKRRLEVEQIDLFAEIVRLAARGWWPARPRPTRSWEAGRPPERRIGRRGYARTGAPIAPLAHPDFVATQPGASSGNRSGVASKSGTQIRPSSRPSTPSGTMTIVIHGSTNSREAPVRNFVYFSWPARTGVVRAGDSGGPVIRGDTGAVVRVVGGTSTDGDLLVPPNESQAFLDTTLRGIESRSSRR